MFLHPHLSMQSLIAIAFLFACNSNTSDVDAARDGASTDTARNDTNIADTTRDAANDAEAEAGLDTGGNDAFLDTSTDTGDSGPVTPVRRAFITKGVYTGDLESHAGGGTGTDAGDKICQDLADAESLGGTWIAWLSDNAESILDRIPAGAWQNLKGKELFADKALFDQGPKTEWTFQDGLSAQFTGPAYTWSGSDATGTLTGINCANWGLTSAKGTAGDAAKSDKTWANFGPLTCTESRHLYCFELSP